MSINYFEEIDRIEQLLSLGKYKLAKQAADAMAQVHGEESSILFAQGYSRFLLGEFAAARSFVDRLKQLDPNGIQADGLDLQLAEHAEDWPRVQFIAEKQLANTPEETVWLVLLASALTSQNKLDRAQTVLIEALQKAPRDTSILVGMANCKLARGEHAVARKFAVKALEVDPECREAMLINSIVLSENKEEFDQAEHELLEVLSGDPNDVAAELSRDALLVLYQTRSKIISFFTSKGFIKLQFEWTLGRVIMMVIFWKGVILWGAFGMLYLFTNWYGAILFNSVALFHKKWKYLQNNSLKIEGCIGTVSIIAIVLIIAIGSVLELSNWQTAYYVGGAFMVTLISASYFRVPKAEQGKLLRSQGIPIAASILLGIYGFFLPALDYEYAFIFSCILLLMYGFDKKHST